MKYRPDIDGLRGIAVLAVLLYHFDLGCPGGYIGVDIFFVISGYLICQIIRDEVMKKTFTFAAFWERRIRRLLPALGLMLLVTTALSWFVLTPTDYQELGATLAAQPFTLTNVVFWRTVKAGYFVEPPEIRPTLHTWSLAVEEQFYLLCPALLLAAHRWGGPRGIFRAMMAVTLVSVFFSGELSASKPVLSYFLLPTRAFEIMLGGLVWYLPPRSPGPAKLVFEASGFVAILLPVFLFSAHTVFPGLAALIPCMGTAILLWADSGRRLLSNRPLRAVGLISYSLYLWHWPVLALWRYAGGAWSLEFRMVLAFISLGIAGFSYRWVETPFRSRSRLRSRRSLLSAAALLSLLMVGVGLNLFFTHGHPERWTAREREFLKARDNPQFAEHLELESIRKGEWIRFGSSSQQDPLVFVWGDSHAMALLPGLDFLCKQLGLRGLAATNSGTPPFECTWAGAHPLDPIVQSERCRLIREWLKKEKPVTILLIGRWDFYLERDYQQGLNDLRGFLQAERMNYYFVLQIPRQQADVPRILAVLSHLGKPLGDYGVSEADYQRQNLPFIRALDRAGVPGSRRIELAAVLKNEHAIYGVLTADQPLYHDDNHLNDRGSRLVAPLFAPYLKNPSDPRKP